ncbi:protein CIMAP1D [Drosophila sulfurigaster albostrigata]|uniref:Outer dense fiber protein 3-like protein 2 n=1 Tax=Drosophila albomicans TaxID=7291 RepID=A0A6P8W7P1_DROAB|nr:outer dense fiber protein 3-like protein 2 [Drosophila albomicans]XP_060666824.1 protein CIMAP1D [Drosophila nasuta]XP_062142340.1 protein CIMAP1D [Drosophila sulfurigaster albostrigata]
MRRQSGPGPAAYTLPSTFGFEKCDARMRRGPQYSFGRKPDLPVIKKHGPGPAEYQIGQITRFGSAKGLEFSMLRRGQLNKPNSVRYD